MYQFVETLVAIRLLCLMLHKLSVSTYYCIQLFLNLSLSLLLGKLLLCNILYSSLIKLFR
jgi:hypothetical protein